MLLELFIDCYQVQQDYMMQTLALKRARKLSQGSGINKIFENKQKRNAEWREPQIPSDKELNTP